MEAETTFDYASAFYEPELREFWGFDPVWQTNDDGSKITTYYYQDEDRKGRPYQVLIEKPDGTDLKKMYYAWTVNSTFNFVYLDYKTTYNIDTGTTTKEDYAYDNTNGNLLTTVSSDLTPGSTAETVTKTNGYINKGTWVWRLASETVTGSATGTARQTFYGYESTTGNLLTTTSGGIILETNEYDSYGNVYIIKDGNLNPTTYSYDPTYTYPETITDAAGHTIEMEWDNSYGKMTSKIDNNGNETIYGYDGYGRKTSEDHPDDPYDGDVIYDYYDTASPRYVRKQVKETSNSYVTSYDYYDGFGRHIQNTAIGESDYIVTKTLYDEMGRNYRTEGPFFASSLGLQDPPTYYPYTETTYDYLGRPLTVTSPGESGNIVTTYSYSGFSTTTTDPDGNVKTEKKDYLGRVIEVQEDSGGGTTLYTYNAAGDLRTVTDDDINLTEIYYDILGRMISMDDPDMGYWEYTYYDNGNLWTQTDAKGQTIEFDYDTLNRITFKDYSTSDPDVTYTYDFGTNGIGLLYSVTNGNVITVNDSYDEMGRVTSVTKTITGDSARTTEYTYDYSGKVLTTTYPDGYVVTNGYHAGSNLLHTVTGSDGKSFADIHGYTPMGKMGTITHGNGTSTTYSYDDLSTRLTDIVTMDSGEDPIQDRTYVYYNSGDIHYIYDSVDNVNYTYGYDNLHRLKTEMSGGVYDGLTVNYDSIGNITSKTVGSTTLSYVYNNSAHKHAVSSINGYSFTYDANGNMLSGYDFTNPSSPKNRQITYNADNMPVSINYNSGEAITTLVYDGTGARAKKTIGTTSTYYIGDHYEIQGGTIYKYIFAGNLRVAQLKGTSNIVSYFHKDHLGSSTVMTSLNGTQVEASNYEPFGKMRAHTGTTTSNYKFTDQELDAENGLYNYDARLYDPITGRFISADTIVPIWNDPQSLNRYAYARNNPLIYTDPSGHYEMDVFVDGVYCSDDFYTTFLFESILSSFNMQSSGMEGAKEETGVDLEDVTKKKKDGTKIIEDQLVSPEIKTEGEVRLYGREAFGSDSFVHTYLFGVTTGLMRGRSKNGGIGGGDPANDPYIILDINGQSEAVFMKKAIEYYNWEEQQFKWHRVGTWYIPYFNDCHSMAERAIIFSGGIYSSWPTGRVNIDENIKSSPNNPLNVFNAYIQNVISTVISNRQMK